MNFVLTSVTGLLVLHGLAHHAEAAAILNCTGIEIRVASHPHASPPMGGRASIIGAGAGARVSLGPEMTLRIYENMLFDVLRITAHNLTDGSAYGVMRTFDGRWVVELRDKC